MLHQEIGSPDTAALLLLVFSLATDAPVPLFVRLGYAAHVSVRWESIELVVSDARAECTIDSVENVNDTDVMVCGGRDRDGPREAGRDDSQTLCWGLGCGFTEGGARDAEMGGVEFGRGLRNIISDWGGR